MSTMMVVGWVDAESVAQYWAEADDLPPAVLTSHLQASYEQCVAFLPPASVTPWPHVIPERWKQAQIKQARALHRSDVVGSGDQGGGDGLSVTVFPMDWTVKNLLRPSSIGRVT